MTRTHAKESLLRRSIKHIMIRIPCIGRYITMYEGGSEILKGVDSHYSLDELKKETQLLASGGLTLEFDAQC